MQSDVTLVGGTTPPALLPAVQLPQQMAAQVSIKPPATAGLTQSFPRPASIGQTAVVTEAKVALSAQDTPTALSQAERVLKPYGVTMLPEPPVDADNTTSEPGEVTT